MKYYVITPPYGDAPFDCYGSDVVEVESPSKKQALVAGLRELRKIRSQWISDQKSNRENPFKGLKVEKADDNENT